MTLAQPIAYILAETVCLGDQWQKTCMKTIIILATPLGDASKIEIT